MSGTMPAHIRSWRDFSGHFERLAQHGIVNSIKDFYWDVRPKPEYGTIELRVLDTPLHPGLRGGTGLLCARTVHRVGRRARQVAAG
jgi:gamma-glutamyl:cysteine ligase YbdK (ATP-grasp superfamily)